MMAYLPLAAWGCIQSCRSDSEADVDSVVDSAES